MIKWACFIYRERQMEHTTVFEYFGLKFLLLNNKEAYGMPKHKTNLLNFL